MKRIQAFTCATLQLIIGGLAGLLLISVPASAAEETPDLELSAADELALNELAAMFGNDNPVNELAAGIVLNLPKIDAEASLERSLDDIDRAIETCGIDTDFTAPPPPTGDELFDAYAQAVDDRLNAAALDDSNSTFTAAVVPDNVLAGWEPEFGNDPHYWELRYILAKVRENGVYDEASGFIVSADGESPEAVDDAPADGSMEQETVFAMPVDYLLEAERRGCASANTLLLLYDEVRLENSTRLEEFSDYEGAKSLASPAHRYDLLPLRPEFSAELIDQAVAVHTANEAREEQLLEAACFRGYNEAWPYYLRGFHCLSLGQFDTGLRDLKKGNSAPVNRYPLPFPVAEIEDSMLTGEPIGGPVVCGAFQIMLLGYNMPEFISMKNDVMGAMIAADLGGNIEAYDACHHFACRLSESREGSMVQSLVSMSLIMMLRDTMIDNHYAELSPGQLETLWRFNSALELAKIRYRQRFGEYDDLSAALTLGFAGGPRGFALNQYLIAALDLHCVHDSVLPVFADLAEVSYLDLATPQSMLKYEALTEEVYEARRLCRRGAAQVNEAYRAAIAQRDSAGD